MRILLVEDDELLGSAVKAGLEQASHTVDWLRSGVLAANALQDQEPDAAVLDLGLPDKDGLTILKELRARGSDLPVLILTARDTLDDRITGLDTGADDYLVKPFELDELTARLRAISRRRSGRATLVINHGNLEFDPAARTVKLDGELVPLPAKEINILETLLERPGHPFSKDSLEQMLYGWGDGVESNTIEVHIHHLRKKLGKDQIRTMRGIGYLIPSAKQ